MKENSFLDNLIELKEVDSTNSEAFRQGKKCAVVSEYQTTGRGRLGRSFIAEAGQSLLLSVFETEVINPQLTAWVGVLICKILRSHSLDAQIKWPNDIQVCGKKICGILCEMKNNAVVIGIGINLYQDDFEDLNLIATSAKLCGVVIDKKALLKEILTGLDQMLKDFPKEKSKYLQDFNEHCNTLNQKISVTLNGKTIDAFAKGIDENFKLILELANGETIVKDSGELESIVSLYTHTTFIPREII